MANIVCGDKEVFDILQMLVKQFLEGGGFLNPDLEIHCSRGEISMHRKIIKNDKALVSIPLKNLINLENVKFSYRDETLSAEILGESISPSKENFFHLILKFINITGKIPDHKKHSPWTVLFSDQETLKFLYRGRDLDFIDFYLKLVQENKPDQIAIDSFFRSRILNLDEIPRALTPFIDFFNHNSLAQGYVTEGANNDKSVSVLYSPLENNSSECFVSYGPLDCYDVFLNFGFFDKSPNFVRSIPLKLEIPGFGEIKVHSRLASSLQPELPESVKDLEFFFPGIENRQKSGLELSYLLIPGKEAPLALKRVLMHLLENYCSDFPKDKIMEFAKAAETQIIVENLAFYQSMKNFLALKLNSGPVNLCLENAYKMAETQIEKLEIYMTLNPESNL